MRTANPALNDKVFQEYTAADRASAMTIMGTVHKTAILLAILVICGMWPWNLYFRVGDPSVIMPFLLIGTIGGLITAVVTVFKKTAAPISAPIYAALEGLALGAISALFEARYPGIVLNAVQLTIAILVALLLAYRSGLIKATENFKLGVVAATGGIFLVYMANFVLGFFGFPIGFVHDSGPMGIIFSLVVVGIAAMNLVLDFDFIENGAERGAPKFMEWYGAFGLLVTLIWLYLEILRLLAKLQNRR